MKLFIASDIHGSAIATRALAERVDDEMPDRIILLGDLLYHGPRNELPKGYSPKEVARILNGWADMVVAVRGNCDAEVDQMMLDFPCRADYALIETDEHLLYLTHGHLPGMTPGNLPHLTPKSAFLSGHTHIKALDWSDDILLVNPGSTSIPKDGSASYAIYDDGFFTLKTLRGETIVEMGWDHA